MRAIRAECGLCRQVGDLRQSHFLPRALYRLARDSEADDANPIVVTGRRAAHTSRQVRDEFLCARCEDRFSAGGEQHVLGQVARRTGEFRLRELVRQAPLIAREERWALHDVSGSEEVQSQKYLYFAASIFWRSAARSWPFYGQQTTRLPLGDDYQEEFRRYLLAECGFPEHARLFVHVWTEDPVPNSATVPSSFRVGGVWRHKFCVPGITFTCFVGARVGHDHDAGALNGSRGSWMWLSAFRDDALFRGLAEMIGRVPDHRGRRPTRG